MSGTPAPHISVLIDEVLAALAILPGETHVDGTFGAGGYSRAMLAAGARVIAFDRDPDAIRTGEAENLPGLTLVEDRFSRLAAHIDGAVDGVTYDIGVSSMQLDQRERDSPSSLMARSTCGWNRPGKVQLIFSIARMRR